MARAFHLLVQVDSGTLSQDWALVAIAILAAVLGTLVVVHLPSRGSQQPQSRQQQPRRLECPRCGSVIDASSAFCPDCGNDLT